MVNISASHVIVTGGGTGVGAQTAQAFAIAGARVTIMGRSESTLAVQGLNYCVCDVTDRDAVMRSCQLAREKYGPITIAIANAGMAQSAPFAKLTSAELQASLAVNLFGVMHLWQATQADMLTAGWGRMIAIASTAGLKGYPYVSAYCAAKHAVVGLVRALSLEFATRSVTVNAICPGFIDTPLLARSIANIVATTGMSAAEAQQRLKKGNPQQRFIQTDEVAASALWLCSEAARSINGHALSLSGGEI